MVRLVARHRATGFGRTSVDWSKLLKRTVMSKESAPSRPRELLEEGPPVSQRRPKGPKSTRREGLTAEPRAELALRIAAKEQRRRPPSI